MLVKQLFLLCSPSPLFLYSFLCSPLCCYYRIVRCVCLSICHAFFLTFRAGLHLCLCSGGSATASQQGRRGATHFCLIEQLNTHVERRAEMKQNPEKHINNKKLPRAIATCGAASASLRSPPLPLLMSC